MWISEYINLRTKYLKLVIDSETIFDGKFKSYISNGTDFTIIDRLGKITKYSLGSCSTI